MCNSLAKTKRPCRVCGGPTAAASGICSKNKRCARAQKQHRRCCGRIDLTPLPAAAPCKVCGEPTRSRIGICNRTPACRNEAVCHRKGYTTRLRCAGCGGPLRSHCKWRFCTRNPLCRRQHDMEAYRAEAERKRECGRRWVARHRRELQERSLVRRRLRGVGPPRRGQHHPHWAGGRVVFCFVCGQCAGWRSPSQLRRRRRFLCKEHGRESWKWNLIKHQYQPQHAVPRVPEAGGDR